MNIAEDVQEEDKEIVLVTITTTLNQVFVTKEFISKNNLIVVVKDNERTFINPDQIVSVKVLYK
jgi:hypothetical protein